MIRNLEMLDHFKWVHSDGYDIVSTNNATIDNCLGVTGDDTFDAKAGDTNPISNILYSNDVGYSWEGDGTKVGVQATGSASNIIFRNSETDESFPPPLFLPRFRSQRSSWLPSLCPFRAVAWTDPKVRRRPAPQPSPGYPRKHRPLHVSTPLAEPPAAAPHAVRSSPTRRPPPTPPVPSLPPTPLQALINLAEAFANAAESCNNCLNSATPAIDKWPPGAMVDAGGNFWMTGQNGLYEIPVAGVQAATGGAANPAPPPAAVAPVLRIYYPALAAQASIAGCNTAGATGSTTCVTSNAGAPNQDIFYQAINAAIDSIDCAWVSSPGNDAVIQILGIVTPTWPQASYLHPSVMPQ